MIAGVNPLLGYLAAGGAALAAGVVNAVAGGGTLISFPTLVALGLPAVASNITNTVALSPGYLGGSLAQRRDLASQRRRLPLLLVAAGLGGLGGSILLVHTSEALFRDLVPFLILLASLMLALQEPVKRRLAARAARLAPEQLPAAPAPGPGPLLLASVLAASVYGGYFGAGLGIMLLAVLGLDSSGGLKEQNAVKQVLSLIINVVAAVFFGFSGQVVWRLAAVMAGASLLGGNLGGRLVQRLDPRLLRVVIVLLGLVVAVSFWLKR